MSYQVRHRFSLALLALFCIAMPSYGQGPGGTTGDSGTSGSTSGIGTSPVGSGTGGSGAMTSFGGGNFGTGTFSLAPNQFVTGSAFQSTNISQFGFGSGQGGTAGITSGVTQSNILGTYYGNPYAKGIATATQAAFGTPIYRVTTTTSTQGTISSSRQPGAAGGLGLQANRGLAGTIPQTTRSSRAPMYAVSLDFDAPARATALLRQDLEQVLARSDSLSGNRTIRIDVNDSIVVLRGTVANDRARRLAENLLRLTPGVRDVQNELLTAAASKPAPGIP